jgi:hypothetical protein
MDEKMLKRQINRYSNDAERFKIKGDKSYAVFKAYGNNNDYLNSQRYYAAAKRANDICKEYEVQLHRLK